jgi:hypothetical protein
MLKAVKESVHRMTNQLQLISGYLEMEVYPKALGKTRETMKELHTLATSLTGLAQAGMTVAEGWGSRGSAWLHSGEPRRCERGCRQ